MIPGIYPKMSNADYHASEGVGSSRLRRAALRTPAHLQGEVKDVRKDAWDQGTLIHTAVLEPEEFESRVVVCDARRGTNAWKEAEAYAATTGAMVSKSEPVETALAVRDAVMKKPNIRAMLSKPGNLVEHSAFAIDVETSTLLKVRPDLIVPDIGWMIDVKSTKAADEYGFSKSIAAYGYHFQAVMYMTVWRWAMAQDINPRPTDWAPIRFAFLAIEKEPPYECAIYDLDEAAIEEGYQSFRRATKVYAECLSKDEWPGYPDEIKTLALPGYAFRETDSEKQTGSLGFPLT